MRYIAIIIALSSLSKLTAQTTLEHYRQEVIDYSFKLKVAASQTSQAEEGIAIARVGLLPSLSASGSFTALLNEANDDKFWTFNVTPQILQNLYSGGGVRARLDAAQSEYDIALCNEAFTLLEVRYAADYAYWNLSAFKHYVASVEQYVKIIETLRRVVNDRFVEGYVAKGDLLMIQTRLSEAQYSLISIEQNLQVAHHNFNTLRGVTPNDNIELVDDINDTIIAPMRVTRVELLDRRPDYMASEFERERLGYLVKSTRSSYLPQLSLGIGGAWQPYSPNINGSTTVQGSAFVQLSVPIFNWGERRKAVRQARMSVSQQQWVVDETIDNIVLSEMNGWTAIIQSQAQMTTASESLINATENLAISTFSYSEGQSTILDVMQAQISWIQAFSNQIAAHYNYALAIADYERITAKIDE